MSYTIFTSNNFKCEGTLTVTGDTQFNTEETSMFDTKNRVLCYYLDLSNNEWYFNYLEFVHTLSTKNLQARPNYLLNLGYIPIIYLPSCLMQYSTGMFERLDKLQIPYVKTMAMSFANKKCDLEGSDAWISKLDAAKILNCLPEEVTSRAIIEEVFPWNVLTQ